jgi:hypothetical protein
MSTTADDDAILDAERRSGTIAGAAALLSILAAAASVIVGGDATRGSGVTPGAAEASEDRARAMLSFVEDRGALIGSTILQCVGILLMIVVGIHLYRLTRTRDAGAVRPVVLWLSIAAPILVVASTVGLFVAFDHVADTLAASGPRTSARATQLVEDSGALTAAQIAGVVSRIVAGVWLVLLAVSAMRVGLLTRFLGYWGVAGGVCLVLLPVGSAMVAAWIVSVGILAAGFWPGGRPAAWDSTQPQEIEAI